jgi:YfiH family protein
MDAEHLQSPLLRAAGFRHAFFTRRGGVSEGAYASLNFSVSVGDDPERVDANFARAGKVLELPADSIAFLSQVHGSGVVSIGEADADPALGAPRARFPRREGDALLGTSPNVACGVRTADCVPILVGDRRSGAAVAIHAGWRGLVRGVIEASIAALRELAGERAELVAAIGPHIGPAAFEVGDDVARELEHASSARGVVDRSGVKARVALEPIARRKLEEAGVRRELVDLVPGCTLSEKDRFFSFRRDGKASGRHLSVIVPRC